MRLSLSKLFVLGCLTILFVSGFTKSDTSSDDNNDAVFNADGNQPSLDGFNLDDFFGGDDSDLLDGFDADAYKEYYSRHVLELNSETLPDAVSTSSLVLVLFLDDPEAEDNKKFEDFFKTVTPYFAGELNSIEVTVGKFVVDEDLDMSYYYLPENYPSFVLFDHVRMFEYDDKLDLPEFFGWFTQITSRELVELTDQDSLDRFLESDDNPKLVAFYNLRDTQELQVLNDLATKDYLIHLDIRQVAMCLDHCSAQLKDQTLSKPSLVLFRDYEGVTPYVVLDTNLTDTEAVYAFCNYQSLPPVLIFDELNQTKIFGEIIKGHLTLFLDEEADNTRILAEFQKSALYNMREEPPSQRVIHIINYFDEDGDSLQWFYNIKSTSDLPKVFLTETSADLEEIIKYKYNGDEPVTFDSLKKFINDYRNKNLEVFYISEDAADNQGKIVSKLVGSIFRKEVIESNNNNVVFICPDMTDELCSEPLKTFEKAAQKMTELGISERENLKFGFIDALKNELDLDIGESFPEIKLYRVGNKRRSYSFKPVFTADELIDWVQAELAKPIETKKEYERAREIDL